jgi:hypothetical protein
VLRSPAGDRMLRSVLATNATTSFLGGLVALVAGPWLDEVLLGTGHPGWVRLVGGGLVLFAAGVAAVARSSTDTLPRAAQAVSVADAAWVAFTLVTIVAGWYSTSGAVAMAVVAVMVAVFGVEQAVLGRRLLRSRPR